MSCSKIYCACGCGKILTSKPYKKKGIWVYPEYNNGHYWNGRKQSKEMIDKRIVRNENHYNYKNGKYCKEKKYYCLDCGKEKSSKGIYCKDCVVKYRDGKWKQKISDSLKGHAPWNKGLTKEDHPAIMSSSIRMKNQELENNFNWKDGKSFEPYPLGWNKTFKEQIRYRDEYKCQICGKPEVECKRKLHVHHIDYNKMNLKEDNLISLCQSCHMKTNGNRKYWTNYFQKKYVMF